MVRAVLVCLRRSARLVLLLGCLVALAGCGDLRDFGGTYRGNIVKGSFVRSCFSDTVVGPAGERRDLCALLQFDPDKAVASEAGVGEAPNTLTTSDGTFAQTVLEPVQGLANDHLSLLDFPGPQRLRNYLLLARPLSGPLAGRDVFVVVSLLASEDVEVRVIARSADESASCAEVEPLSAAEPREYFGLFRMERTSSQASCP